MSEPIGIRTPEVIRGTPDVLPNAPEHHVEQRAVAIESTPEVLPVDLVPPPQLTPAPVAVHQPADQLTKKIEDVMADGLHDAYAAMDPVTQQRFKESGEETATAIERLLKQSTIQMKKIVHLILRWLRIIPNVNPYYLEQQAKIKADAIVALHRPPRIGT